LRNHVQRVASRDEANGRVAEDRLDLFPCAAAVTTKTVFILVNDGIDDGNAIGGTDAGGITLRETDRCGGGNVRPGPSRGSCGNRHRWRDGCC